MMSLGTFALLLFAVLCALSTVAVVAVPGDDFVCLNNFTSAPSATCSMREYKEGKYVYTYNMTFNWCTAKKTPICPLLGAALLTQSADNQCLTFFDTPPLQNMTRVFTNVGSGVNYLLDSGINVYANVTVVGSRDAGVLRCPRYYTSTPKLLHLRLRYPSRVSICLQLI
eukprot:PhM_4_TR9259/c0_g1_i3/m.76923